MSKGFVSISSWHHCKCFACNQWWAVEDPPADRVEWFCPWCGQRQLLRLHNTKGVSNG